jgi:hypothetical protein
MKINRIRFWLLALSLWGVAGSHWAGYLLAAPNPDARAHLLASTGHSYWPVAASAAWFALAAGAASFLYRAATRSGYEARGRLFVVTALSLMALQATGFVLLEATERVASGMGIAHLLQEPAVLIGLALEAVVALVGAGLVWLLARAVEVFQGLGRSLTVAPPAPIRWHPAAAPLITSGVALCAAPRGPPVS